MSIELTVHEIAHLGAILREEIRRNNELAERSLALGFDDREWINEENEILESVLKKLGF